MLNERFFFSVKVLQVILQPDQEGSITRDLITGNLVHTLPDNVDMSQVEDSEVSKNFNSRKRKFFIVPSQTNYKKQEME